MPLNKLDNFIKNTEGRILYVSPSDLDSTDSITNQGNSLAQPFKTLQRALLESARFSYRRGNSNDETEKTTILLMPGAHTIDNRPGFVVYNDEGTARVIPPGGVKNNANAPAIDELSLELDSVFDLTQENNILYKFNSINGGVVVPRGTSIVGLDLRKTKVRPRYVPNPTDVYGPTSAIFRITGACYFWQFSIFDGDDLGTVYTDSGDFSVNNQSFPTFSHHKLTCFEYADGVTLYQNTGLTDLDMYYAKLSNAFNLASGRDIDDKYPANPDGFAKQRPEWEIVGAFANDPIRISTIQSGSGGVASNQVTVKTLIPHELTAGTPIKISGVGPTNYNISTKVQSINSNDPTEFTYLLFNFPINLQTPAQGVDNAFVTIDTDTVSGASPYIFNISLRSVWGMNGMHSDGSKASGFRSMVVAQFTAISLQKDDRAFVKYNITNRNYSDSISISKVSGASLSSGSSSLGTVYHSDPAAIYRSGWESSHIKGSNDSFMQIVSVFAIGFNKHFDAQSGGDMSITNSNSNFGQISLSSSGFRKKAFDKDNKAFITSIIAPRAITGSEQKIDWIALDVTKTISVANNNRLYLFGFTSKDVVPPILTQGYRVGAALNDKLYFKDPSGTEHSANILMTGGGNESSVKEYVVSSGPSSNIFTIGTNNFPHYIQTGEKVFILSDVGDLPENIVENTVYYAIRLNSTEIKLAGSESAAIDGVAITVYAGTNLRILSRVSDKIAGDVGHPVQYDGASNNWYITTNANSGIYGRITTLGTAGLTERTEPPYIKRLEDSRSLDEKTYKLRVVIPKENLVAKNPENAFVIQESSSTGIRSDTDINLSSINSLDYDYNRNPRFISTCSYAASTVTVISELPHNLQVGDSIIIKNVTDSTNTGGYNGTFDVATIVSDMSFTYITTTTPGSFTNVTTNRTISLPRFERNKLLGNFYIYRKEVISQYIKGNQDGVYHVYALTSDKTVPTEFTSLKYSQNVVDLYPQLDRDNNNDNPASTRTFAKRSPLGDVVTSDLKKSITRESTDSLLRSLGIGLDVSTVNGSTITFVRNHGLSGIVTGALVSGAGYISGTYQNVRLLNGSSSGTWNGATAKVIIIGGGISSVDIVSSGSGYANGGGLFFDSSTVGSGNGNARYNIATSGIVSPIGNVIQFTGAGTNTDTYHRITSVVSPNQIGIARTGGDPTITSSHYGFIVGPSIQITSTAYSSGTTTFTTNSPHGLVIGNRFRVIDSSNNNLGDYIVKGRTSITEFTSITNSSLSATSGYILKHGFSANNASSDSSLENLGTRSIPLFDKETLVASSVSGTTITVSNTYVAITKRFPLGSYVQIDEEIMRVASSTLTTPSGSTFGITVIRGALGTRQVSHDNGSLIRKIKPISIELRRPSILRASGHTFEYLGYGPGNYSTGLPQVQSITLTEREEFLVQSQERSGGIVVYTGMNNNGDSFVGNRKTSSATGEEVTYDVPIPTVTGEDPSRLSVVFDEVTIKERLVVEGGSSGTVLSQFDGPVTFNKEVKFNGPVSIKSQKITDDTESISTTTGALVVPGGVGIGKRLNVGGTFTSFKPGSSPPTFTTRSIGTKIVLLQNLSVSSADYAFGIDTNTLWNGVPTTSQQFGWYGGTTIAATLSGVGALTAVTSVSAPRIISTIATGTSPFTVTSTTVVPNLNVSQLNGLSASTTGTSNIVSRDASGNFSAGTITAVLNGAASSAGALVTANNYQVNSFGVGTAPSGTTGEIRATNDITAFYSSDERLKENILPIPNALEKVLQISGNTFDWKSGFNEIHSHSGIDVGVIAQEIEQILPEIVMTRENGYKAVQYEKLVPLLIEAIKDLKNQIDELKNINT